MMRDLCAGLSEDIGGARDVVVWGAGELTMKLLRLPPLRDLNVIAIVDSNKVKQGRRFGDIPVVAPRQVSVACPIVIGSILHVASIKRTIKETGLRNPVIEARKSG